MSEFDVRPLAPNVPGADAKASVGAGATSAATALRALTTAGGFVTQLFPAYYSFKAQTTTAGPGFHIVVGDSSVGAPTDADMLITDVDGWVRVLIPANATHFRIKSEGTTVGSVYAYPSS